MYVRQVTQNPTLVYFLGISWAVPNVHNLLHRAVQDWRAVEANCLDLEMHKPFSTAKKTLASDTLLLRLSSVPLKVTALVVSDGDSFARLKMLFLKGNKNWAKVGKEGLSSSSSK